MRRSTAPTITNMMIIIIVSAAAEPQGLRPPGGTFAVIDHHRRGHHLHQRFCRVGRIRLWPMAYGLLRWTS